MSLLLINLIKLIAFRLGYQLVGADQMVVPKGSAAFDRQEAQQYGLNEAIILAEMRGWIAYNAREGKQTHRRDGVYWLYNSPQEWRENHFPWWSEATIRRTLDELAANGLATCRAYGAHNARRWWTVGQIDATTSQPVQTTLQFATSALQSATHTYPESSNHPSSKSSNRKTASRVGATRKGAVADFGSSKPGVIPEPAANAEGREGFDREAQPVAGSPVQEHRETPSPSSAAPLPHQSLTPNPSPGGEGKWIPAWVREFWDGATTEQLQQMLQKYGEGRLMAAQERARRAKGVVNPPGFALHLLEQGLIGAVDTWDGAPDEDADTDIDEPDVLPDETTPDDVPENVPAEQGEGAGRNVPDDVRKVWEIALSQLEIQFDRAQFASCIRGARVVAVDGDVLVVEARSAYARDCLEGRMYRDIRRVVRDAMRREVQLQFVVKGENWRENAQEAEAA
ncbi:MAG: hypothetical protein JNJ61_26530 [Anaerolineae bacterium]|nr:hypothetical protein [Anaerolineae bacterium]